MIDQPATTDDAFTPIKENNVKPLRVAVWGTYDTGKPRTRILLKGLRELGVEIDEYHHEVWKGVEDKSQIRGLGLKLLLLVQWIAAYPGLLLRFMRMPRPDIVLIPYMGLLDVLILWPFKKVRRIPVIWDAFLSIYNTVTQDRHLFPTHHPLSRLLWSIEWLACRAADRVVLDTKTHAAYFSETFGLDPGQFARVFVGAETDVFTPVACGPARISSQPFTVLFYGQFIPLHGIETVVRAAKLTEEDGVQWQIIGVGQEAPRIRCLIAELSPRNLSWIEWVPYRELCGSIQRADVCLGIFGTTDKAQRVIPNKVFQALAAGCPLITGDTPAIRELMPLIGSDLLTLVEVGNPRALAAEVIRHACREPAGSVGRQADLREIISPRAVSRDLRDLAQRLVASHL